jgi:hypothetical protein
VVNESEQAIITLLGRPVGRAFTDAGLHLEPPFVDAGNFYSFLKSMETLGAGGDTQTVAVLSTDGELYRFLDASR